MTTEGFTPTEVDAYMHQPTDQPNFNESAFYELIDAKTGFSLLVRVGNRVNEGHAEMTVLAWLPDGRTAFNFSRTPISGNESFSADGLTFAVKKPMHSNSVRFDGIVRLMDDSAELENPGLVFRESPTAPMKLALEFEDIYPMYEPGESMRGAGTMSMLSVAHYRGPIKGSGTVEFDGTVFEVSGFAFRDHSWGPRNFLGPDYWRWLYGIADENNWYEGYAMKVQGVQQPYFGIVVRDGVAKFAKRADFHTEYGPAPYYPSVVHLTLHMEDGEIVDLPGRLMHFAPLRHGHPKSTTRARIMEMIIATEINGLPAYGFSEMYDRLEEGVPVGMGEV